MTSSSALVQLRKFSVVLFALVATTALCAIGKLDGVDFASLTWKVVCIYVAGNVASGLLTKPTQPNDQGGQP